MDYGAFNWAGYANIGAGKQWIKLPFANSLPSVYKTSVIPHEIGHNLDLRHASYYNGDTVVGITGDLDEYGNIFDVMGDGHLPESGVSTYNKQRLDWLYANNIEYVNATDSGYYRLYRFDAIDATNTLTLRLERNSSNSDYYWLGYQRNYADDGSFDYGLAINWQRPGKTDRVYLLDMTPGSKSYSVFQPRDLDDSPLTIGHTYYDASANLYLTPYRTGGTSPNFWIDSQINYGSFPNNNSPTATLNMVSAASAGELVVISVTANDSNGDSLAFAWDTGDGTVYKNYSTIAQIWQAGSGGTKTVTVTVSDMKGGTVSVSQDIYIADPFIEWSSATITEGSGKSDKYFSAIASSGTNLVSIGTAAYSSTDGGSTWSQANDLGSDNYIRDIVAFDNYWLGVGFDYDSALQTDGNFDSSIHRSANNGSSWSRVYYAPGSTESFLVGVATDDGSNIIAVGGGGVILRSTSNGDSGTWSQIIVSGTANVDYNSIAYGSGYFVAISNNLISVSANAGTNWITLYNEEKALHSQVIYANGDFWVASNTNYDIALVGGSYIRLRSPDAVIASIAYGNGVFVALHQHQNNNTIFTSSDGNNWVSHSNVLNSCNAKIHFSSNTFLVVGQIPAKFCVYKSGVTAIASSAYTTQDTDSDQIPDIFEINHGLNYQVSDANLDLDGDGVTNLVEYQNGNSPDDNTNKPPQLTQIVTISGNNTIFINSEQTLTFSYNTSNGNRELSGLGIRVHYNSDYISFDEISSILSTGQDTETSLVVTDSGNYDNDSNTNKLLELGWSATSWPNVALPVTLFKIKNICHSKF